MNSLSENYGKKRLLDSMRRVNNVYKGTYANKAIINLSKDKGIITITHHNAQL